MTAPTGGPAPAAPAAPRPRRTTTQDLRAVKERGERWPMLTAYDMYTAALFEEAGVPVLLVGDSAGDNVYGYDSTVPVTVEEMLPLCRAVTRSTSTALVVGDLPFGSYQAGPQQALATGVRFVKEGGVQAVKLEGGRAVVPSVAALVTAGVPVMAHLGLTPQSHHALGGYRVQGRGEAGETLLADARALQEAGAFAVVLEKVPAELGTRVTEELAIPTVGIGAGPDTDAQVLVWQDLLGLRPPPYAKFVRPYADLRSVMGDAVRRWAGDVREGRTPTPDQSYS